MSDKKLTAFFDNVGRTIFGEQIGSTETQIEIKNPVVLHVQPQNDGRMALQLFPCFFREFLIDPNEGVRVKYNKSNIAQCNEEITFNMALTIQYTNMFAPVTTAPTITPTTPLAGPDVVAARRPDPKMDNVIKLFDD